MSPRMPPRRPPDLCEACRQPESPWCLVWVDWLDEWHCADRAACYARLTTRRRDADTNETLERRLDVWAREDEEAARQHDEAEVWAGKGRRPPA